MNQSTDLARRDEEQAPERSAPRPQSVLDVFSSEAFKRQVALALPRHIDADHMMRIAMTEVRQLPDLQRCTPASFMAALLKAAQSGLRPGMFGEGWIIPRWNSRTRTMEAAFQPGYMGLVQLAYRSGEVSDVTTAAVYAGDHFVYALGSDPRIEHQPDLAGQRNVDDIIAFYAVVRMTNGGKVMKVMRRSEVDDIRDRFAPRNKAGQIVGPWASDYQPMGEKTVLIQALKFVPKDPERSAQLSAALGAENDAIFADRVASSAMGQAASSPVADRVAERLGVKDEPPVVAEEAEYEPIEGEVPPESGAAPAPPAAPEPQQAAEPAPADDQVAQEVADEDPGSYWPSDDDEPEPTQIPGMDGSQAKARREAASEASGGITPQQMRTLAVVWRKLEEAGWPEKELRDMLEMLTGGKRSRRALTIGEASAVIKSLNIELQKLGAS